MTDTTEARNTHAERWTSMDKAAIELIREWMAEGPVRHTMKDCAQVLNCSYPRIRAQFRYAYSPLTLGDFTKLCDYFGKDPFEAWLEVASKASRMAGDDKKASEITLRANVFKALSETINATELAPHAE
ncbi:hypothetical protein [Bifidobacterium sp.]|uniref:hypothetical protein n=1 Tax=Bifidobacterium sp. TaxID=41200 RepID=UPI003D7D2A83